MKPQYTNVTIKLPRIQYPSVRQIIESPTPETHYQTFKRSVLARNDETLHVLKAAEVERAEWLQLEQWKDPVFTHKVTSQVLRIPSGSVSKVETTIVKKTLSPEAKQAISEARKFYASKIDEESQEFLDVMQADMETRFPDPSESLLKSIEKDRDRELEKIRSRNMADLQRLVDSIYTKERGKKTTTTAPVNKTSPEVEHAKACYKSMQAQHYQEYKELSKRIDEKHETEMEKFRVASRSFNSSINVEGARHQRIEELREEREVELAEFRAESGRLSRSLMSEMLEDVDEDKVWKMVTIFKDSVEGPSTKQKESKLDIGSTLKYVDKCYVYLSSRGESWESMAEVLSDCWIAMGKPADHECVYIGKVRMYARLFSSDHGSKFSDLDKQIEEVRAQIRDLYSKIRDLDKHVSKRCRDESKKERVLNAPVKVSDSRRRKQIMYEQTVANSIRYREVIEETKPTQMKRVRPK